MKKALLISNIATKFTNFIVPSIEVLQERGYEVHTCANYSNFKDDKTKYNIKMHHIDFQRNPFNLKNIKAYKQMQKLMKEEKFDLVHCNTPIGGVLGRICAKKMKVPKVIYTAHGFHFYKGAPLINNVIYKNVEKLLARYTDILVTMNEEDYKAAQKFKLRKNGKVMFIHGVGIDESRFNYEMTQEEKHELRESLGIKDDDFVLIQVGELNKNKNQIMSIKAMNDLVKENKKIHLLLVGRGELKEYYNNKIKEYNLVDNVHILGYRMDIPKLMKISNVLLSLSYREGLPRSMMEAMAAGLPCVVSKIRGNIDLLEDKKGRIFM